MRFMRFIGFRRFMRFENPEALEPLEPLEPLNLVFAYLAAVTMTRSSVFSSSVAMPQAVSAPLASNLQPHIAAA
jgi:hypothetical protein